MIVIENRAPAAAIAGERLLLNFNNRCQDRLHTRLESGEEAELVLEPGTLLRGGDKLRAKDGRIIEVVAATEALLEVRSGDPMLLTRAAYYLGRRHVAIELKPGLLRLARDPALAELIRGLGLKVLAVDAPFEPEADSHAIQDNATEAKAGDRTSTVISPYHGASPVISSPSR